MISRSFRSFLFVIAVLMTMSAAEAEDISPRQMTKLLELSAAFSDCVVVRQRDRAMAMVIAAPDNKSIMRTYSRLIDSECMGEVTRDEEQSGIRFSGDTFMYSMAAALAKSEFGEAGPRSFGDRAPLDHRKPVALDETKLSKLSKQRRAEMLGDLENAKNWYMLSVLGECGARSEPESVRKIALTSPGSIEEKTSLKSIVPTLGNCLPPETALTFKPWQLRGALLVNYVRLASAPQVTHQAAETAK